MRTLLALLLGVAIGLGVPTYAQITGFVGHDPDHTVTISNYPDVRPQLDKKQRRIGLLTDDLVTCQRDLTGEHPAVIRQRIEQENAKW